MGALQDTVNAYITER